MAFNAVVALPKVVAIRVWSEVCTQSTGSQEMLASLIHSFVLVSRGPQPTCYWKFHKQVRRWTCLCTCVFVRMLVCEKYRQSVFVLVCLCICTFVKSTDNPQKAKKSDQFNLSRVERKDEKEEQVSSLQLQKLFCMFKPNIVSYGAIPLSLNLQRKLWTVWLHRTALLKLGCSSQLCLCRGRGTFL